ncbi:MAG: toll/interleukin-1 receptor domain-containing protein [Candidatus Competibacteraceae bacterium]|nr:toll/interleukin-1 receptor domain-containing protein [Candidatus Competibacteraceae bacterium]
MKPEQLKDYISMAAVVAAVVATSFSFLEFKGIGDSSTPILIALAASAYAAVFSVYVSRMRERRLRQRRVFIIYSSKDRKPAAEVVHYLRVNGYNPWFDVDEIAPGQKWEQSVMKGIGESAVALYLVSENMKSSNKFVSEELKTAMSIMRSKDESFSPVIPVRLDDAEVPQELADVHWVDLRSKDGLEQLEKGLNRVLGQA